MRKREILIVGLFAIVFNLYLISAASSCPIKIEAKSTSALLAEIPSINTALQNCQTVIPSQLKKVMTNGVLLLEITDNDDIAVTIQNGAVTSVSKVDGGAYTYKLTITSCQLDVILSKENPTGAFASYYLSGKANLGASGFFNKMKLFFGKIFIKSAFKKIQVPVEDCNAEASKKPSNCYETYMQGFEEYQYAKQNWDKWLNETGHVCQTQTAERPNGECKYLYEQIKNNDKKWLCWY